MIRLVLVLVVALGCSRDATSPPPQRAFYFWRTTFHLSDSELHALSELHVTRLYVRAFDVTWGDGPTFTGELQPSTPLPPGIEVIPVVFVRTEVLSHGAIERLARDIREHVAARMTALGVTPHELQVDCDWTDKTRDAYFELLRGLRTPGVALTATIRLHQVKYRERTGVPPIDRGMLMFYNMGKFSADPGARVIFDADAADHYIARIHDYPKPLDVALPIWSWITQVRDDRVVDLLQSTDPDELAALDFLRPLAPDRYVATRTAFVHGVLLREGDELQVEITGPAETLAAATMVAAHLAPVESSRTVTLFDLSERNLARHATAQLDHVFRSVH
jgi:hypothetical protein